MKKTKYIVFGILAILVLISAGCSVAKASPFWGDDPYNTSDPPEKKVAAKDPALDKSTGPAENVQADAQEPLVEEPEETPKELTPEEIQALRLESGPGKILQLYSGSNVFSDWKNGKAVQLIAGSPSETAKNMMLSEAVKADATTYLYLHSDPGTLEVYEDGELIYTHAFTQGWLSCVVFDPGTQVVATGVAYNDNTETFNIWPAMYGAPKDFTEEETCMFLIYLMQGETANGFEKDAQGHFGLASDHKGLDPTAWAVYIDSDGNETVIAQP